ncbi:hypothetical protein CMUS01_05419 [Colletotrichum musicola]|uniref:Uncharacterized protein n=1 Tax=Colletotrichum musicola TaxID=2175873 RepID=A0A8H6NL53_9PEZI|nr:hypothetical protein CMUS01_05419 [Colletotrichum musicola]
MAQGPPPNLEQERDRWFAELAAYKQRFEAERESHKSRLSHEQQSACRDLEEQARFVESQRLSPVLHDLFLRYQAEIRKRRLDECKTTYDRAVEATNDREKEVFQQHHMKFPLPANLSGRKTTPSNSTVPATNGAQIPAAHAHLSQVIPPLPRPSNSVPNNMSSASMPSQQGQQHNQQHSQQQQWSGYGQPASRHSSPHMTASMYQPNRGLSKPAEAMPPRTLPSNGQRSHYLGNGMPNMSSASPTHGQPNGSPHIMNHAADPSRGRVAIPHLSTSQLSRKHVYLDQGPELERQRQAAEAALIMERQRMQLKRKSDQHGMHPYHDAESKRSRTDTPHSQAPRTIKFEEIYQNGEAEFKHTIVKFEDIFYILKCDEHGVHFKQNALAAAAKHLHGASHGHLRKEHRLAVQKLGFHVVDCTDELQARNNAVVAKAFEDGYKPLNQLHGPKSGGKRHSGGDVPRVLPSLTTQPILAMAPESKDASSVIKEPRAGELYQARWSRSNKLYVVMALGWTDLTMCGWAEKFCDLALYKEKSRPQCFVYNSEGIAGWAEGYRDGEPRVLHREVPVMWFETNGKNRLGWVNVLLLKPFLLDDPDRSTNPDDTANQARLMYALNRGFSSFEAMLAWKKGGPGPNVQEPVAAKEAAQLPPSAASDSQTSSQEDDDMYDFGDNPPKLDDSADEDYVEGSNGRKHNVDSDEDEDMADDEPSTPPQPRRRNTQDGRPNSRMGSGEAQSRSSAAAGTRASAKKDTAWVDKKDVTMSEAAQMTPPKSRATAEDGDTPKEDASDSPSLPQIALGTPRSPEDTRMENAAPRPEQPEAPNGDESRPVSNGSNPHERPKATAGTAAEAGGDKRGPQGRERDGGSRVEPLSRPADAANNQQGERSNASKSPSVEKETPRVSPKLQLSNLLNDSGPEKAKESAAVPRSQDAPTEATKSAETRRPLPSQAGQHGSILPSLRHPLPPKPTSYNQPRPPSSQGPLPGLPDGIRRPSSSSQTGTGAGGMTNGTQTPSQTERATEKPVAPKDLSVEVMPSPKAPAAGSPATAPSDRGNAATEGARSASAEGASHRSDPRMSIMNALGGQSRTTHGASNGASSGNVTPRVISLSMDDRWRAVRTSESPIMSPAMIRPPVDRSAASSPVPGLKRDPEGLSIDVASFSEGNKSWSQPGKFLHFHIEDEARGVARSKQADGIEATIDAQRVKAAQLDKRTFTVRLVLEADDGKPVEQRFVFESNSVTGSQRGPRPQAMKFYSWVTTKNSSIEHIE